MMTLKECLMTYFPEVAACYSPTTLEQLSHAYREPQRHYHDTRHIVDLLEKLHRYRLAADRPDLIAHAILWHDSVFRTYEQPSPTVLTPRSDALNVEDSAKLFEASDAALTAEDRQRVAALVRATSGHDPRLPKDHPHYNDTALFLDLDLSVLALPFEAFSKNTDRIRMESPHQTDHEFFTGCAGFLDAYRVRPDLYLHPVTAADFNGPARQNMERQANALKTKAGIIGTLP